MLTPYKYNFDAIFYHDSHQITAGWIIRDYNGIPHLWGSAILGSSESPLEAEAKALLMAIQKTWSRGFTNITFENDNKLIICILHGTYQDFLVENICSDILQWSSKFIKCLFHQTKRSNNVPEHTLAKQRPTNSVLYSSTMYPPHWLYTSLYSDYVQSFYD